ncbi:TetR/AcrR family transcriptional regulator [Prescottella agglutinans]|uniref:TetR/AcrR family transcriptional regulator n=1 Tax=Prescottella agglutinans TaxID=1644129 RepID=UPI003D95C04B
MADGIANLSRQAILDGAISLIAHDRNVALSEVARRLGVGRTSLYRHFSDRGTLLEEVRIEGARRVIAAIVAAHPGEGSGLSAVARICEHLFDLGPVLSLLLADNPIITDADLKRPDVLEAVGSDISDDSMQTAIARGHRDGTIDTSLPADWIETFVWMTLAAGHLHAEQVASRRIALDLVLRSVCRSLAPTN